MIFIWYVTSTRYSLPLVYSSRARGLPETIRCSSPFQPQASPLSSPPPFSLFCTTSAAVMPAANAREKLTQASPYGRARCIDRLLRCTTTSSSSTLAREPILFHILPSNPAASLYLLPLCSSCLCTARNPLLLAPCATARPGFSPVSCATIPDLTLLRRRFARRDATRPVLCR